MPHFEQRINLSPLQTFLKLSATWLTIPNVGQIKICTSFLPLILKIGKDPDKNNSGIFDLFWQRLVDGANLLLEIFVKPTYGYCFSFSEEQWTACLFIAIPIYVITIFVCRYFRIVSKYYIKLFLLSEFMFHYFLALSNHYFFEALNFSYQGQFLLSQPLILAPMMFLIEVVLYYFFLHEKDE